MSVAAVTAFAQNELLMGKNNMYSTAAYYDLGDPTGVNIEVNLWGFVRIPGRYKVPYNTTFMDLMSYAGGPVEDSDLEDIRIYRKGGDSTATKNEIIKLNYNDLLWSDEVSSALQKNPVLRSNDVVVVPEQKRYTLRENVGFFLSIFTGLISIITLVVTLTRK